MVVPLTVWVPTWHVLCNEWITKEISTNHTTLSCVQQTTVYCVSTNGPSTNNAVHWYRKLSNYDCAYTLLYTPFLPIVSLRVDIEKKFWKARGKKKTSTEWKKSARSPYSPVSRSENSVSNLIRVITFEIRRRVQHHSRLRLFKMIKVVSLYVVGDQHYHRLM